MQRAKNLNSMAGPPKFQSRRFQCTCIEKPTVESDLTARHANLKAINSVKLYRKINEKSECASQHIIYWSWKTKRRKISSWRKGNMASESCLNCKGVESDSSQMSHSLASHCKSESRIKNEREKSVSCIIFIEYETIHSDFGRITVKVCFIIFQYFNTLQWIALHESNLLEKSLTASVECRVWNLLLIWIDMNIGRLSGEIV